MQYEIKALHDRLGITMIYVTHDQGEALTMSDRIAVFAEGIVQHSARRAASTSSRRTPSSPTSSARTTA